jgi:hypothetical protein
MAVNARRVRRTTCGAESTSRAIIKWNEIGIGGNVMRRTQLIFPDSESADGYNDRQLLPERAPGFTLSSAT